MAPHATSTPAAETTTSTETVVVEQQHDDASAAVVVPVVDSLKMVVGVVRDATAECHEEESASSDTDSACTQPQSSEESDAASFSSSPQQQQQQHQPHHSDFDQSAADDDEAESSASTTPPTTLPSPIIESAAGEEDHSGAGRLELSQEKLALLDLLGVDKFLEYHKHVFDTTRLLNRKNKACICYARKALRVFDEAGVLDGQSRLSILLLLAQCLRQHGSTLAEHEESVNVHKTIVAMYKRLNGRGAVLARLASMTRELGIAHGNYCAISGKSLDKAIAVLGQSATMFHQLHDVQGEALSIAQQGAFKITEHDPDAALVYLEQAQALLPTTSSPGSEPLMNQITSLIKEAKEQCEQRARLTAAVLQAVRSTTRGGRAKQASRRR